MFFILNFLPIITFLNMLYDEIEENNTNPIKNLFFKDTFHLDHDFKKVFYLKFFKRIRSIKIVFMCLIFISNRKEDWTCRFWSYNLRLTKLIQHLTYLQLVLYGCLVAVEAGELPAVPHLCFRHQGLNLPNTVGLIEICPLFHTFIFWTRDSTSLIPWD